MKNINKDSFKGKLNGYFGSGTSSTSSTCDTNSLTNMSSIFSSCNSLQSGNISNMFSSCTSLNNITIKYENKYVILGEEYKTDYAFSIDIVIAIATLNVLGKPYWIELKKQNFSFGYDLDKFIEERIIVLDRDRKIDDILI